MTKNNFQWTRVRTPNGYAYVKTRNSRPIEFSPTTGYFRVYVLPNDKSHSFETSLANSEEPTKSVGIQRTPDDHNAAVAKQKEADEHTDRVSLTPERFIGILGASVPLAAGALGATTAAPMVFNNSIAPLSDYIAATKAGQLITKGLTNPYFTKGVESAFAAHGINHTVNEGIKGPVDAVTTALEIAPLAQPLYKGFKYAWEAIPRKGNLVGYGSSPADTPLGKIHTIDSGLYPDFSKMTRAEKIYYLKTLQELAQRVDQARNLDALRMTKDRLRNGGFDRLEQSMIKDADNISSDILTSSKTNPPLSEGAEDMIYYNILNNKAKILKAKPTKGTAKEVQIKTKDTETLHPENAGTAVFDKYFAWFRDAPQKVAGLSKGNKGVAHEFTHYFYFPFRRPKGFNPSVGNLTEYLYYTTPASQEIVARGTQLKNYFGLKEGEQLTPEMWNYAQRHYIADVANNNMRTFFKAGNNKSPNHSFFLKWLNRNAPAIGGVTTVGTTLLNKNK